MSNCPRCQIVLLAWSVSNCPRCQIVLGVKLSSLHGQCQIVLGVKLSAVSNCPITKILSTQNNFSRITLLQSSSIRCLCHEKELKRNKMLADLHNLRYCLAFTEYLGKVLKWLIILRKIKVKIIFIQLLSTLIFYFIIYSWSVVPLAMFLCLSDW